MTPRRSTWTSMLAVLVAVSFLVSCKVEEEIRITKDGSGTYQVRISVQEEYAEAISEVKQQAAAKGMQVVEEGSAAGERFVVFQRDFSEISELSDDEDSYALTIEQESAFRGSYRMALDFRSNPSEAGFERVVKITLPATIENSDGGTVTGRTVEWDCSRGGSLTVVSSGWALPAFSSSQKTAAAVVGIAGLSLLVLLRIRRRKPATVCGSCGRRLSRDALFCPACGVEAGPGAAAAQP